MSLIDPSDPLERQVEKLTRIADALMRRIERAPDPAGMAYAEFERAAMLEEQVRARTRELERALDLLQDSNARLSRSTAEAEATRTALSTALETIQEGFALFGPNDRLAFHNSRFCRDVPDVAAALAPGMAFEDYVARLSASPALALPEGTTAERWRQSRLRRHADPHASFDVRLVGDRWIRVSEDRTDDGGTVILQTDVTAVLRRERREHARQIDRQARLTRATLDHVAQGICTFDRAGRLQAWNAQMEAILAGVDATDAMGLPFARLLDRMDGVLSFAEPEMRARLARWAEISDRPPLVFEMHGADGAVFAVSMRRMPDAGFVVSFADVTAERRATRDLAALNETLERRVAERTEALGAALEEARRATGARTRFLAAASHDLLQPLSAAKMFAAALEDRVEDGHRAIATKTLSALASAEAIIEALLDLARLEFGQAVPEPEPVALEPILAALVGELAPAAQARGMRLRLDMGGHEAARGMTDRVWIRRVMQNLAANAVRHADPGDVTVGLRVEGDGWRLFVRDGGPGIAADDQAAIFDEFRRLGRVGRADGLGLGLSIVDRACSMLGHPLALDSAPGRGSTFAVTVPRATGPADDLAQGDAPAPSFEGLVVLLVENDEAVAQGATLMIEGWGAEVIHAPDAESALELMDELGIAPDALLIDYQLGCGMDGLALLEALRDRFGPLPGRVVSADRDPTLPGRAARAGAPLLRKPISRKAVSSFLAAAVRRQFSDPG